MYAIIISIGDELLIGQTINTNSSWIGQTLTGMGLTVLEANTIADKEEDILQAIDQAFSKASIVLVTGGLGPTSDDLTLPCLVKYFNSNLIYDDKVWQNIRQIFHMRGREINEDSKALAYVPDNAHIMYNTQGTAPGTIFFNNGKMLASMPGVPYEMKAMVELDVIPFIRSNFSLPFIINKHILTAGVGETQLAALLTDLEAALPENFKLAYLPNVGKVKLRISGSGNNENELRAESDKYFQQALKAVEQFVYGFDEDTLEGTIGALLKSNHYMLGVAESCTGGYIGHQITSVPGSSAYFKGGIVCYSNEIKQQLLGVQSDTLETYGAVSEETVQEMLSGALDRLNVDVAIAVSGVAGPDGGTADKPVGTVYIGVADRQLKIIRKWNFTRHRERNIQLSGVVALVMLRKFLLKRLQATA